MHTAIVWDREGLPDEPAGLPILWNGWVAPGGVRCICIPQLVEDRADLLRKRYLAWVEDFGRQVVAGKSLVEHLEIRPGFSAWWMSLLVEKSILKSPQMTQAIKMFAFEESLQGENIRRVALHTKDPRLAECIRRFCERASLDFEWVGAGKEGGGDSKSLHVLRAVAYLGRYVLRRWTLRSRGASWKPGGIFFLDYLLNVGTDADGRVRFASHYWTALVDALRAAGVATNWLHLSFLSASIPSFREARDLIAGFNHDGPETESHNGLDQFLSLRVIVRAVWDYLTIFRRTVQLPGLEKCYHPAGSAVDLAPLMERDWDDSTCGKTALWNMLCLSLFEAAMKSLPPQKCGVYLQENMGWERAFVYCWRRSGQGKLIGFPHTFVRFWDLRYFPGPAEPGGMPRPLFPDVTASTGPWNRRTLTGGGYGGEDLADTEALRYLFLAQDPQQQHETAKKKKQTILICGDIVSSANHTLLSWLELALGSVSKDIRVVAKAHPAMKMDLSAYPGIRSELSDRPVRELAAAADYVVTSNVTSAAVDACGSAARIIQVLDGTALNFSPLRGVDGVCFVRSANELLLALEDQTENMSVAAASAFFLDPALPRWKALLGISSPTGNP